MIDRVSQSLNCLTNASPLFPFISFTASQISHLRPWEIQYLICEVYCLGEWKAVDATDNCYRQKDNYRSFGALSKRMTCLGWFKFESPDVLYALLAVLFLQGLFTWCHKQGAIQFINRPVLMVDSSHSFSAPVKKRWRGTISLICTDWWGVLGDHGWLIHLNRERNDISTPSQMFQSKWSLK